MMAVTECHLKFVANEVPVSITTITYHLLA